MSEQEHINIAGMGYIQGVLKNHTTPSGWLYPTTIDINGVFDKNTEILLNEVSHSFSYNDPKPVYLSDNKEEGVSEILYFQQWFNRYKTIRPHLAATAPKVKETGNFSKQTKKAIDWLLRLNEFSKVS